MVMAKAVVPELSLISRCQKYKNGEQLLKRQMEGRTNA
jgi:hypothetical protein